jgi:putative addiction module component (TIGR02574 family)
MTLAAVEKLAIKLPLRQRMKLANMLLGSIPPMRESVTLQELERRADEVEAGTVKTVSYRTFAKDLAKMKKSIGQRRPAHRG